MPVGNLPAASQLDSDLAKKLFNNVHVGIAVVDQNRRILRVNQTCCNIFGYAGPEEVIGTSAATVHLSEERFRQFGAMVFGQDLQEGAFNIPYEFRKKDGTPIWVQMSGEVIDDGQAILWIMVDITERRQAEAKIRESEAKFRIAFATIPEPVALTRIHDGIYLDVNEKFLQLSGYSREELVGRSSIDVNIWKNHSDRDRLLQGLKQSGKVENLEAEFLGKGGRVIYGLMSARIIEIDGEKVILSITRDYTDRKLAEEKYATLVKEANVGIALVDAATGELLECNQALADLVERSQDELIGRSQAILYPPHPLANNTATGFAAHRDAEGRGTLESKCITRGGEALDVEIKASLYKLGQRDVMLGFFQDISYRKRQERMLQARLRLNEAAASLPRKELLQKFVDEAESMTESEIGFLHFVNSDREYLAFQMWSTNTMRHCTVAEEKSHGPIFEAGVWLDCVRKGQPVIHNDYERLAHRKDLPDGHPAIVRELVVPLFSDNRIVAILGVGNKPTDYHQGDVQALTELASLTWDIIARKESEDKKQELEVQLRQKYKMEAVGVMAGGIAHNFNNNLAIILGNLEMAGLKKNKSDLLDKYLGNAKTAVLRSRDLVAQILTYSHQDQKELGPVDLGLVVRETLSLLKSTLPASVSLACQAPSSHSLIIKGDPGKIQEALINLCNNAVYAMNEKGQLKIDLTLVDLQPQDIPGHCFCQAGPHVCLTVEDSGCGIDQSILDRIFDPFFTTKSVDKGTGMGLSTVQGIVDQHGGMIKVASTVGTGTSFHLFFPMEKDAGSLPARQVSSERHQGRERILLVDDDTSLLELVTQMLEELGYRVTAIDSSSRALTLFAGNPSAFDLVITDQTMPELTGEALVAELRKISPGVRVVLMTGFSSQIDEEQAVTAGVQAFCLKPLEMTELSRIVRNTLDSGRQQGNS